MTKKLSPAQMKVVEAMKKWGEGIRESGRNSVVFSDHHGWPQYCCRRRTVETLVELRIVSEEEREGEGFHSNPGPDKIAYTLNRAAAEEVMK